MLGRQCSNLHLSFHSPGCCFACAYFLKLKQYGESENCAVRSRRASPYDPQLQAPFRPHSVNVVHIYRKLCKLLWVLAVVRCLKCFAPAAQIARYVAHSAVEIVGYILIRSKRCAYPFWT